MLAKSSDEAFDHEDWIFEIKWDGYRAVADLSKKIRYSIPETAFLFCLNLTPLPKISVSKNIK